MERYNKQWGVSNRLPLTGETFRMINLIVTRRGRKLEEM
jgi:hypothetical protein